MILLAVINTSAVVIAGGDVVLRPGPKCLDTYYRLGAGWSLFTLQWIDIWRYLHNGAKNIGSS